MSILESLLTVNKDLQVPVYLQITNGIIGHIRRGTLKPESILPSSRTLAAALNVHRKTVVAAYDELYAQSWVDVYPRKGIFVAKSLPDVAPKHVAQIKTLTRQGFYDGTPFHRVIEGFMAQGGDPTGTGTGGSKLPNLPPEFSQLHFVRGVCGMARASDPGSANSQFFIMFGPAPALDGKYTIWGRVVRGMEYVDQIKPKRTFFTHIAHDIKHARDSKRLPPGVEFAYDGLEVC